MTITWFTADWHFNHARLLGLGDGRPFDSIEEHDAELVRRHNSLVDPRDTVWVLGDAAMGKIEQSFALCAQMNGSKVLVCGNHDRPAMTSDENKRDQWVRRYINEGGFDHVIVPTVLTDWTVYFELSSGDVVGMSHYPYSGDSQDGPDRYVDRRPVDHGGWLLHGHVHDRWLINGRQINVGVDRWDFKPVQANRIERMIHTARMS